VCGIAGVIAPGGPADVALARARALSLSLAHRGPDGTGEWVGPGVVLAHRRLAILDPSDAGRQPMASRDGRWGVVYNGILYNNDDLRGERAGPWRSRCDTETLVEVLADDGIAGVERLVGMFAFAAWDDRDGALYLVRDRLGIKPLHFVESAGTLLFASEPGALAAAEPACRAIDETALASYLALGYPPRDRTLFRGVHAVLPGEIVRHQAGRLERRRYWRLPDRCETGLPPTEWQERFERLWRDVPEEHLLADVPVGVFLSGGMDSSAVAVALRGHRPPPLAFTASFAAEAFDDSGHAATVAARLGLPARRVPVDAADVEKLLPRLARHADTPVCDSSAIGTWLLCEAAAREVKVALSGDGADEVFGGYLTHRATELLQGPAGLVARLASAAVSGWLRPPRPSAARIGPGQKVSRFLRHARHGPLRAHLRWRTLIDEAAVRELRPALPDPWPEWERLLDEYPEQSPMNRALAADVEGYLVQDELTRVDRMGMAHGLELRVPFLDHRVVELGFRMPYGIKCRRGRGKLPIAKWLAARGFPDVASAPKRGFNHPVGTWFRQGLADRLLDRLSASRTGHVLSRPLVENWLRRHRAGAEDRSYELWTVLFLLEWIDAHEISA
jgi:asparagine synthase (glutamine-hydrolysing)